MKHLHLTISPEFFTRLEDFLLNEQNLAEFFNRIGAIIFNDYCTFYYSPAQQMEVLKFLETIDQFGYKSMFLNLLDSENVEEAASDNMGSFLFKYLRFGTFPKIEFSAAAIATYEKEHVALIDFSNQRDFQTWQVILDKDGDLQTPKKWEILPTFATFLQWSTSLNPRTFDDAMDTKHPANGRKGSGSSLLCSKEEVKKVLQCAFYKNAHHENHLYFYHSTDKEAPILWLKSSSPSFHFHGFHISVQEARNKNLADNKKLNVEDLELYSSYLKREEI